MDNLGKAIDVSVDILSEKVWYFYVFPFFFLKVVREEDCELYLDLIYDRAQGKRGNIEYDDRINKVVKAYSKEVELLREKSDIIFGLADGEDPLAFFQEMMSQKNLNEFRTLSLETVLEIKKEAETSNLSKEQILEKLNVKV